MKVAVASTGKKPDSQVSLIGARAPYFLIFEDKKLVKVISNPFRIGGGGAGFAVSQMLENEEVKIVVSGSFGVNMKNSLKERKIKAKAIIDKTVKEAVKEVMGGKQK
ncbi:hypothetical protein KY361_02680 [Candidatus Woesearchaeota archaeon]|nr:hypothetical protein [Candidatus Woesearchaeota archaeon]